MLPFFRDLSIFFVLPIAYPGHVLEDEGLQVVLDPDVVGRLVSAPARAPQHEAKQILEKLVKIKETFT